MHAPGLPDVFVDPTHATLLLGTPVRYPSIAGLAEPWHKLAGTRIVARDRSGYDPSVWSAIDPMAVRDGPPGRRRPAESPLRLAAPVDARPANAPRPRGARGPGARARAARGAGRPPIGKPALYLGVSPSPDGHLLVETIHRPDSRLTTARRFAHDVDVWDRLGTW